MKEYRDYYFAYIDLLGFKEMIKTKSCEEIISVFNEAKRHYIINEYIGEEGKPVIPPDEIHYYVMSDSICIFIRDNVKNALPVLLWLCMYFQVRMLKLDTPVLVRGSISRGAVSKDQDVLFGPAMVEAYLRAEKLAHYPRIIIPKDLCDEISEGIEKTFVFGFIRSEQDGFYSTNYLEYFCMHRTTQTYIESVQRFLESNINRSLDQSVREKYLYVKSWIDLFTSDQSNENQVEGDVAGNDSSV